MKAIVQDGYGSPDVLRLQEIDRPALEEGQVLIRVRAASVNALDKWFALGRPYFIRMMMGGMRRPKPRVRGVDLAGDVEAIGSGVHRFKPGDQVYGRGTGAFAEYATAKESSLVPKPPQLGFEEAAALPVAGLTALIGLRDTARVKPGQRVLIYGAGGGVGTFAVQVAKALGARVTAVTSTANAALVRSLGADEVIDYTQEDVTLRPERYDVFFDISGSRPFGECVRVLAPGGKLIVVGGGNGKRHSAPIGRVMKAGLLRRLGSKRIVVCMVNPKLQDLVDLASMVDAGKVASVIDRRYQLNQVPDAFRYLETGRARGKITINVA